MGLKGAWRPEKPRIWVCGDIRVLVPVSKMIAVEDKFATYAQTMEGLSARKDTKEAQNLGMEGRGAQGSTWIDIMVSVLLPIQPFLDNLKQCSTAKDSSENIEAEHLPNRITLYSVGYCSSRTKYKVHLIENCPKLCNNIK